MYQESRKMIHIGTKQNVSRFGRAIKNLPIKIISASDLNLISICCLKDMSPSIILMLGIFFSNRHVTCFIVPQCLRKISALSVVQDATIGCEHFGREKCPGCIVQKQVWDIPVIERAQLYFSTSKYRTLGSDTELYKVIVPSNITQWRTQAKLAVAPKSSWGRNGCIFGLYERGSHRVMEIPRCMTHHPTINEAVATLTKASDNTRTTAYNEDTGEGDLRYVMMQTERSTGTVCLTLVWNANTIKDCQPGLARFTKELKRLNPNIWHSIWCNCNSNSGNVIFSRGDDKWHRLSGPEYVREPISGPNDGKFHFSPKAFRQGNLDGFEKIAQHVAHSIPMGAKVCELYAGIGFLGLTALTWHAQNKDTKSSNHHPLTWLRCSDENPENDKLFQRTLDSMPKSTTEFTSKDGKVRKRATYVVASASRALLEGQALGADVIIVDPPRKGLDDEVLNQLCKPYNPKQLQVDDQNLLSQPRHTINWTNDVHTLIYVSCGFDSLARDCDKLLSASAGWKLDSASGYILFPGSDHVESVVIFKRRKNPTK